MNEKLGKISRTNGMHGERTDNYWFDVTYYFETEREAEAYRNNLIRAKKCTIKLLKELGI